MNPFESRECAPIVLFVYNRLDHTMQTVRALQANHLSDRSKLYVICDGARTPEVSADVEAVRDFVKSIEGFATVEVICRERNYGLANSIIDGLEKVSEKHKNFIVLEDDLVTSPYFLMFMNEGLDQLEKSDELMAVCGYVFPVPACKAGEACYLPMPSSWGWATTAENWKLFEPDSTVALQRIEDAGLEQEFDRQGPYSCLRMLRDHIAGKNNSWFIRWHASACLVGRLCIYPPRSMVRNVGFDGSGVHCASWKFDPFSVSLEDEKAPIIPGEIREDRRRMAAIRRYYRKIRAYRYLNFFWRRLKLG